jgi:hypothetical protein
MKFSRLSPDFPRQSNGSLPVGLRKHSKMHGTPRSTRTSKQDELNDLIAQAETDIAAGRVKPLDEVLGDG